MKYKVVVITRDHETYRYKFDDILAAKCFAYEEAQWETCKLAEIRTERGKLLTEYKGWMS